MNKQISVSLLLQSILMSSLIVLVIYIIIIVNNFTLLPYKAYSLIYLFMK